MQNPQTCKVAELVERQPVKKEATCLVCAEGIKHPICSECLENQLNVIFGERTGMTYPYLNKMHSVMLDEPASWCVICGNLMNVCAHCSSVDMLDGLISVASEMENDFRVYFNFYLVG